MPIVALVTRADDSGTEKVAAAGLCSMFIDICMVDFFPYPLEVFSQWAFPRNDIFLGLCLSTLPMPSVLYGGDHHWRYVVILDMCLF